MDYQRFIDQLPQQFDHWQQPHSQPKSPRFQQVFAQASGMTTPGVMQVLNFAVKCMEPGEIYCEIGTYQGTTLIGALLDNPEPMAYGVDNFSEYDPHGESFAKLTANLEHFGMQDQVYFCNQDFEAFFHDLQAMDTDDRVGVYFYDGAHDYRSTLMGLMLAAPLLADRAVILLDDSNWGTVRQAIQDFIHTHPASFPLLDLPTPQAGHASFWNGIYVLGWDRHRDRESASTPELPRQPAVIQAIYHLQMLEQKGEDLGDLFQEALQLQRQCNWAGAERRYQQILLWNRQNPQVWSNLALIYYETERYQPAISALVDAIKLDPNQAALYYNLGLAVEQTGKLPEACTAYQTAVNLDPQAMLAWTNLGSVLSQLEQWPEAEAAYRQAIALDPQNLGSHLGLGNLFMQQNQFAAAIAVYQAAQAFHPDQADLCHNLHLAQQALENPAPFYRALGDQAYQQGQYAVALAHYQDYLAVAPGDPSLHYALSDCYWQMGEDSAAIATLTTSMQQHPRAGAIHYQTLITLIQRQQVQAALDLAQQGAVLAPDDYTLQLMAHLLLPMYYQHPEEIGQHRRRFARGLQALTDQLQLETPTQQHQALQGVMQFSNFYLVYQAHNDRPYQAQYGQLVHRVMAANYPQWVEPLALPAASKKIRVGYLSAFLCSYSGTLWLTGWLTNCDRDRFEVYCYHTGSQSDLVTEQFRRTSDVFHHIPNDLPALCTQVRQDDLHILVFPELGMHAPTLCTAALRLAPVQCTAWGHPVTSGLPTVDYYLSSHLMETEAAQTHYTETLVRLPNLAFAYPQPALPALTQTRSDFGLREDAVVYFCCQAPFKYLPQHDYLLAAIAQQVPQAQFVFFRATEIQPRLHQAFAAVGLDSQAHCCFLPVQSRADYLMLNLLADVYLDSIGFTGGNTSLDALACNLPIVTLPGEFMRGRLSAAMLQRMGLTATIAQDEADYLRIAVTLGLDADYRQSLRDDLAAHHVLLFDDRSAVTALEEFYRQVATTEPSPAPSLYSKV